MKFLRRDCEEAMVKIKLAFRPEEQAEDAQEYALQGGGGGGGSGEEGRNHLNVQNFGHVNLLEQEYDFTSADGPIGGIMVQPVPIHDDGDVFHVPFDLEGGMQGENSNEEGWVEAEDDGSEYEDGNRSTGRKKARRAMDLKSQQSHDSISFGLGMNVDSSALAAVNLTLDSDVMGGGTQRLDQEEEEEWHAFDPEEEEEEEENIGRHELDSTLDTDVNATRRTKESDVSEIELVRADESQGQISMIGRPSAIGSDLASIGPNHQSLIEEKSQVSDGEYPIHVEEEEEEEVGGIPFEETADLQPVDSSFISVDDNTSVGKKRKGSDIDGLELGLSNDMTQEQEETPQPVKKPRKKTGLKGPKRLRKRRRVEIDNDATELTSDHIKNMLRDTSDIVQQNRSHPADYEGSDAEVHVPEYLLPRRERMMKNPVAQFIATLPNDVLLGRPNCADDGGVHPKLLAVWEMNFSRLHGKPFPFQLRGAAGEEQRRELDENKVGDTAMQESDEEEDEIEVGRRNEDSMTAISQGRLSMEFPGETIMEEGEEEGVAFTQHDDEDMNIPMEEEEEAFAQHHDSGVDFEPNVPGMQSPTPSEQSDKSTFSLGAVNDLEADLIDEPRQVEGPEDEIASSSTKWHKHTVKVLELLKRNMTMDSPNDEEDVPNELSYDKLSYGTSRRTACGVFFELLQLKTWDFIELEQESSYGDIIIKPGSRFNEQPPVE